MIFAEIPQIPSGDILQSVGRIPEGRGRAFQSRKVCGSKILKAPGLAFERFVQKRLDIGLVRQTLGAGKPLRESYVRLG